MLIRSRNKKKLVNLSNIDTIMTHGKYIEAYNGDSCTTIGEYATEEKAIKVLDMIQNSYQYCEECKYTGVGISQPEFVFQMPQDSEVQV